jgi:hypothetical protein
MAQEPFNGRITHPDKRGVRATISVVGKSKTTRSDGKGRFGLTDVEGDDTLLIVVKRDSMLVAVNNRKSLDITYIMDLQELVAEESEDLANYGYGYVKRRESTDFSSGISGDRLRSVGSSSLLNALLICCPSLRYINGELCLRTQNSINSSSAVLILCDGVEVSNLDFISIYDVGSVEVIKSSNMYGFRGVNGVVLIKTITAQESINRKR